MNNQKGKLIQAGVRNKNGRIYPPDLLSKAIEKYQEQIENETSLGELYHPTETTVSLDRASHIVTSIDRKFSKIPRKKKKKLKKEGKYNPDIYVVNYQFLTTDIGKLAESIKDTLVPSPRGIGSVNSEGIIQDDYELLAIDLIPKNDKA